MPHPPRAFLVAVGLAVLSSPSTSGQDGGGEPLRVYGLNPGGLRAYATESRDVLSVTVVNPNPTGRDARVVVFYPGRADEQYGRDLWVPGGASMTTWLPVGPAPPQKTTISREFQILLYDRTGGTDRLVLPPGEEKVRARSVIYRPRAVTTALVADAPPADEDDVPPARRRSPAAQAHLLTQCARFAAGLPEPVAVTLSGPLPPTADAFDGVDQVVLAGNRLAADPAGRAALRQWVERGGRLWVMLDLTDPELVAPVLGDGFDLHVVDQVGLTAIRLHRPVEDPARVVPRALEVPVDFVRVALPADARVIHTANGWPASFTRPLGRGLVLFTTLGGPGWHRPRTDRDRPSPYAGARDLPIPLPSLEELALEFAGRPEPHKFSADDLRPLLTEEIGYAVPGRGTAAAILGAFALALVGLGLGLRRSRRPELVGWLGPVAAAAAAGAFVALGAAGRRAVPATTAAVSVIEVAPGTGEATVSGLFAVYRPESGPLPLATTGGALLDLDAEGLEGQVRRRIQTDTDAWHWDGLALPAGVRTGLFRDTARVGRLAAVVRFGPDGAEGRLTIPGFHSPADALAVTPAREPIALRLGPDGAFAAGIDDGLPPGQFLAGTVLTDRQQRRQDVYRKLLTGALPQHLDHRDLLFAWVQPDALPFTTGGGGGREIGTALLAVPLEYEPAAADTRVTVPRAFVPYRRVAEGGLLAPTLESTYPVEMRLRFQLPPAVIPLTVEKAVLHARVRAASRRFVVAGPADGGAVPVYAADSPAEPIRLEVTDERLLRLDERGGLHLTVSVTGGTAADPAWKIESLGMDIYGRTTAR